MQKDAPLGGSRLRTSPTLQPGLPPQFCMIPVSLPFHRGTQWALLQGLTTSALCGPHPAGPDLLLPGSLAHSKQRCYVPVSAIFGR